MNEGADADKNSKPEGNVKKSGGEQSQSKATDECEIEEKFFELIKKDLVHEAK